MPPAIPPHVFPAPLLSSSYKNFPFLPGRLWTSSPGLETGPSPPGPGERGAAESCWDSSTLPPGQPRALLEQIPLGEERRGADFAGAHREATAWEWRQQGLGGRYGEN